MNPRDNVPSEHDLAADGDKDVFLTMDDIVQVESIEGSPNRRGSPLRALALVGTLCVVLIGFMVFIGYLIYSVVEKVQAERERQRVDDLAKARRRTVPAAQSKEPVVDEAMMLHRLKLFNLITRLNSHEGVHSINRTAAFNRLRKAAAIETDQPDPPLQCAVEVALLEEIVPIIEQSSDYLRADANLIVRPLSNTGEEACLEVLLQVDAAMRLDVWTVSEDGGKWYLVDFEDGISGLRATELAAITVFEGRQARKDADPWVANCRQWAGQIRRGGRAYIYSAENLQRPLKDALDNLQVLGLLARGRPVRALAELDRIAATRRSPRTMPYFRAWALVQSGRPNEAFAVANEYIQEVGPRIETATMHAAALIGQGKPQVAVEIIGFASTQAIARDPRAYAVLAEASAASGDFSVINKVIPEEPDFPGHVAKLLKEMKWHGGLNFVATKFSPQQQFDPLHFRIEAELLAGRYDDAVQLLEQAGGQEAKASVDPELVRRAYRLANRPDEYAARHGEAFIDGYWEFRYDGAAMSVEEARFCLAVATRFSAAHPQNRQSLIVRADAATVARDVDAVEAAIEAAAALPCDDLEKEQLQRRLVEALFHAGRGIEAYERGGPPPVAFPILARLCVDHGDAALLETILQKYAEKHATDPRLPYWQAHHAMWQDRFDDALRLLQEHRAALHFEFGFEYANALLLARTGAGEGDQVRAERPESEIPQTDRILIAAMSGDLDECREAIREYLFYATADDVAQQFWWRLAVKKHPELAPLLKEFDEPDAGDGTAP